MEIRFDKRLRVAVNAAPDNFSNSKHAYRSRLMAQFFSPRRRLNSKARVFRPAFGCKEYAPYLLR